MNIAVIGATGFVGQALVNEFVNQNFKVTALARDTNKLENKSDKITKINIDVTNVDGLANALENADVVVSAFNAGWQNPNLYADFTNGALAIEQALLKSNKNRFIMIGGAGTLYTPDNVQIVDTPDFPDFIYPGASAVRDYFRDHLSKNNQLDWSFFSPAIEMHQGTSGERKGIYRLGTNTPVINNEGRSVLSVEDLALVIADEIKFNKHIKQQFTAAY